jgi:flagellar basal body-associated protein FliL
MKKLKDQASGFITLIVALTVILAAALVLVYLRVSKASR